jgi:hypothetical protein
VRYNGKKTSALLETTEENLSGKILKLLCGVSRTKGKPLPLYLTLEKGIFRCITQRRKTSSVESDTGKKIKL